MTSAYGLLGLVAEMYENMCDKFGRLEVWQRLE
jgi:hypothetical protein